METEPEQGPLEQMSMDADKSDKELDDLAATVLEDQPAWKQCVAGCIVREDKEIISLSCFHSICSDECLAKMKEDSPGEKLFCGVCKVEVPAEDLQRKITPGEVFSKKSSPDDIVISCGFCVLELPAVSYCADCDFGLCQTCKEFHLQVKSTFRHKLSDDLEEERKKKFAALEKCPNHVNMNKTHYCWVCIESMCERCIEEHVDSDHDICNLKEIRKGMEQTVKIVSKVIETTGCANLDVLEKKKELKEKDWEEVNDELKIQFSTVTKSIIAQDNQLKKDAKGLFLKKFCGLTAKSQVIENGKMLANNVLKTCEEVINSQDDDMAIKFLTTCRKTLDNLTELDKKFERDYDTFVEKDWHFEVDTGLELQSQTGVEGWGHIDYKYKPKASSPAKTYSEEGSSTDSDSTGNGIFSDNAIPSTSAGILNSNNLERVSKLKAKRFGVNGKGESQLSVNAIRENSTRGVSDISTAGSGDDVDAEGLIIPESSSQETTVATNGDSSVPQASSSDSRSNSNDDMEIVSSSVIEDGEK